jgi:hypothetical protein
MKKLFLLLALLGLASLPGCAAAPFEPFVRPIVTGVVMWYQGEAHKYYNEEAHVLYRATKTSLRELDYPISRDEPNKEGGYYIIAGDKDKFKITIKQVKPHITEVSVRVNFMGDKPYAELLYRQIDSNTNSIDFDDQGRPTKHRQRKLRSLFRQ